MSILGVDYAAISRGGRDWEQLAELMSETSRDLADQGVGALPPSVQGAASSFLRAWAGYAGESSAIATGFAGALDARVADYRGTDQRVDGQLTELDGRLGPAR